MKVDLLAIVAHPDDAELCCSGTLLHHTSLGYKTGILDLTQGELGSRGSRELRMQEAKKASEILGLTYRKSLDLGDGAFLNNPETRKEIIREIRRLQPKIVITNTLSDRHPDHGRAAKLVADACFFSGLPKIETKVDSEVQSAWRPKQLWHMLQDHYHKPDIVIDVTNFWETKMESIQAYASQFYQENESDAVAKTPISGKEFFAFLEARAREMGRFIQVEYAEGFVKSRPVGITSLFDLK